MNQEHKRLLAHCLRKGAPDRSDTQMIVSEAEWNDEAGIAAIMDLINVRDQ